MFFDSDDTFLIILTAEIQLVDFSQILENNQGTLRFSLDGTKTFISWEGTQPSFVNSLTMTSGPYTHAEMLDILKGPEWSQSGPLFPMHGS